MPDGTTVVSESGIDPDGQTWERMRINENGWSAIVEARHHDPMVVRVLMETRIGLLGATCTLMAEGGKETTRTLLRATTPRAIAPAHEV